MIRITRRRAITLISQSALALLLPKLGASQTTSRPRSIIWIWPDGGAPQTDMFDPKPDSVAEIRGTLGCLDVPQMEVANSGPPMRVTECFPQMRTALRHCTVLRARQASFTFHLEAMASVLDRASSGQHFLTRHAAATCGTEFVYGESRGVISAFDYRRDAFSVQRSMEITWDSNAHVYRVPQLPPLTPRDSDRRGLLKSLESRSTISGPATAKHDQSMDTAYRLMAQGINVNISPNLIARYGGNNETAMGILTVRELCRQGFTGALLFRDGDWDFHGRSQSYVRTRGPRLDRAMAELIVDVNRGLLGDVLLVYCGEFGRTPRLNYGAGRDHFEWHTAILCGGTIRQGCVYGATDSQGVGVSGAVSDREFTEILTVATAQNPDAGMRARLPDVFVRE